MDVDNPFAVPWDQVRLNAEWTALQTEHCLTARGAVLGCAVSLAGAKAAKNKKEINHALARYVAQLESREADLRAIRQVVEDAILDLRVGPRKNLEDVIERLSNLLTTMEK